MGRVKKGVGGLGGVCSKVSRDEVFNLNIIHPPAQWVELHWEGDNAAGASAQS